jgi:hypothetical protein
MTIESQHEARSTLSFDLADPRYRAWWSSHPAVGDASFDSFERLPANPIHVGSPPYEWPVNGFLYRDPVSGHLYAYVSEYPRGYWPPGGILLYVSRDEGRSWQRLGVVLQGSPDAFDGDGVRPGGTVDASLWYADGKYHLLYGWCKPDNSDGGLAYAWSTHPEGPFTRAMEPVHAESRQAFLLGRYKRVYASTLIQRQRDWLILACMSTPRNAGGTWAFVALTSLQPEGPYDGPRILLHPQSKTFLPVPVEFYPCFVHEGYVYAPATSVARNRTFQVIYRAPLEDAHMPESWEVYQYGSCWHSEPVEHETEGIWGQTFSGAMGPGRTLWALFPSKNSQDCGTISIVRRPWKAPYRQGFALSAPNAPSLTVFQRRFDDFRLLAELRSSGVKRLLWGYDAPCGPDRPVGAEGRPHPLSLAGYTSLTLHAGGWAVERVAYDGERTVLAAGAAPQGRGMQADAVSVEQDQEQLSIQVNGTLVWMAARDGGGAGKIGVLADAGSVLYVDRLQVAGLGEECSQWLLPTEALMGSGVAMGEWQQEDDPAFTFGFGFATAGQGMMAKWNYRGGGFRLWSPRRPGLGTMRVYVDGVYAGEVDQGAPVVQPSCPLIECRDLPFGYHAITVEQQEGTILCDSLEVLFPLDQPTARNFWARERFN